MKKYIIKQIALTIILSSSIVILTNCSTAYVSKSYNTNTIEIQVLKPATIEIPKAVYRYGIIHLHKGGENKPLEITKSEKESLHEHARKSCLNGIYKHINDSEKRDTAIIIKTNKSFFTDTSQMFWPNIKTFCQNHNIDAVIYVDRLKINNNILPGSYYSNYKHAELELKTTWVVLFPESKAKIEKDVIYKKVGSIEDGKDQFIYASGEMAGIKFGKHIIPGWTKTQRKYFISSNTDFKLATEFVNDGDWDEAAKIWNSYLGSENANLAGKAHFNLALYYEMQGDLDKAFKLAKKADKTYNTPLSHNYAGLLHYRIKDQYKLAEQLN